MACHSIDDKSSSGIGSGRKRRMARVVAIPSSNDTSGTPATLGVTAHGERPGLVPGSLAARAATVVGWQGLDRPHVGPVGPAGRHTRLVRGAPRSATRPE